MKKHILCHTAIIMVVVLLAGCVSSPIVGVREAILHNKLRGDVAETESISHFLASVVYQGLGDYEESAKHLKIALEKSPDSTQLLLRLVGTYVVLEDFEGALKACENTIKTDPKNPSLWILKGSLYQRLERHEEAVSAFQEAIKHDPKNGRAYESLVDIAENNTNDQVTLVEVYEKLVELSPDSKPLLYRLGLTLARINDSEGARDVLERVIELDPEDVSARYLMGLVLMGLDENAAALEQFKAVAVKQPENMDARLKLAGMFARTGQYEMALGVLEGLIKEDSVDYNTLTLSRLGKTVLLLKIKQYEEAADAIPPVGAPMLGTMLRGVSRHRAGQEFMPILESLDKIEGDIDSESREYLSELSYSMGKEEIGQMLIDEMLSLKSERVSSKVLDTFLARAYMSMDKNDEAEAILLDLSKASEGDKLTHYYLATLYEEQDRVKEAEKHLRICLKLDPNDADILNFLGYMLADNDMKLDEAEDLINQALATEPESPFYLDSLGWVYYRKGNAQAAIDLIRKSIVLMGADDAELRSHLGDAYLLNGEVQKALGQWRRVRRLDPEREGVQEKIDAHSKK